MAVESVDEIGQVSRILVEVWCEGGITRTKDVGNEDGDVCLLCSRLEECCPHAMQQLVAK